MEHFYSFFNIFEKGVLLEFLNSYYKWNKLKKLWSLSWIIIPGTVGQATGVRDPEKKAINHNHFKYTKKDPKKFLISTKNALLVKPKILVFINQKFKCEKIQNLFLQKVI